MTHLIALVLAASYLLTTPLLAEKGLSPAERGITLSRKAIERQPEQARLYNQLAMALARRARETADTDYYRQGLDAVETSLQLDPDNYGARKARVWCLLGQHEFTKALEEAKALNKLAPDDVQVYGYHAAVEVGLVAFRLRIAHDLLENLESFVLAQYRHGFGILS